MACTEWAKGSHSLRLHLQDCSVHAVDSEGEGPAAIARWPQWLLVGTDCTAKTVGHPLVRRRLQEPVAARATALLQDHDTVPSAGPGTVRGRAYRLGHTAHGMGWHGLVEAALPEHNCERGRSRVEGGGPLGSRPRHLGA